MGGRQGREEREAGKGASSHRENLPIHRPLHLLERARIVLQHHPLPLHLSVVTSAAVDQLDCVARAAGSAGDGGAERKRAHATRVYARGEELSGGILGRGEARRRLRS